jgi:hypothetical protein
MMNFPNLFMPNPNDPIPDPQPPDPVPELPQNIRQKMAEYDEMRLDPSNEIVLYFCVLSLK